MKNIFNSTLGWLRLANYNSCSFGRIGYWIYSIAKYNKYLSVGCLKMHAVPQLVLVPLNPVLIAEH